MGVSSAAMGIMARNQLIEMATASLSELIKGHPEHRAEQKQSPFSVDDVTAMVAGQIGQLVPMDKETADLFQQLMKKMIEQAGK